MSYVHVAIGVVVGSDLKVLVARRAGQDRFAGMWEFPGGKIAKDETPVACLHRELAEELGINVRIAAEITPLEHDYGTLRVRLHPFLAQIVSGEPKPLSARELKWVTLHELAELSFPEANVALLERLPSVLRTCFIAPT